MLILSKRVHDHPIDPREDSETDPLPLLIITSMIPVGNSPITAFESKLAMPIESDHGVCRFGG